MPSNDNTSSVKSVCPACRFEATDGSTVCPRDGVVLIPLFVDPLVDSILDDRYEIISVIGFGGITAVYKANDTLKDRTVVVKLVKEELSNDASKLMRFQRAAKAASVLSHRNIVALYDCVVSPGGKCYLVAEYVEGTTLADLIGYHGALSVERGVQLLLQLCDALIHAHDHRIIHRNLKPSNILIAKTGEGDLLKLADFGIAKQLVGDDEVGQKITRTGQWVGSPLYMSPEQAQGKPVDARSDIFSLGKVMLEAFRGKLPLLADSFSEQSSPSFSPGSQLKISTSHPEYVDPVPAPLRTIIARAMHKDPEERYQSVRDLKKDLAALSGGGRAGLSFGMRPASWAAEKPPLARRAMVLVPVFLTVLGLSLAFAATPAGRIFMTELYVQYREGIGSPSDGTLVVANQLADLYRQNGRLNQALAEDEQLVGLNVQVHGGRSIETAAAYVQLAKDWQTAGNEKKAKEYALRALECLKHLDTSGHRAGDNSVYQNLLELEGRLFGKESEKYVIAKLNLSLSLLRSGADSLAQQWLLEIVEASDRQGGRYASLAGIALTNLAERCMQAGDYDRAIAYFERAEAMMLKYGLETEQDASIQCSLASIYMKKHEFKKAETALKNILPEVSPTSSRSITALVALSNVYLEKGDLKQSEAYARESMRLLQASGQLKSEKANAMSNLLACYVLRKDLSKADAVLPETQLQIEELAKNDLARIRFYEMAGNLSFIEKKWRPAAQFFRNALAVMDANKISPDLRTVDYLYKLAGCEIFLGENDAAESAYKRLVEVESNLPAAQKSPAVRQSIEQMGRMLKDIRERSAVDRSGSR